MSKIFELDKVISTKKPNDCADCKTRVETYLKNVKEWQAAYDALLAENERLAIKVSTFEALNGIKFKHEKDKCPACKDEINALLRQAEAMAVALIYTYEYDEEGERPFHVAYRALESWQRFKEKL